MRIGILNSGGDCPGLNAVIHGVVGAASQLGWEVIGFKDGFEGLLPPGDYKVLKPLDTLGILKLGGTILGTTNKGDPFAFPMPDGSALMFNLIGKSNPPNATETVSISMKAKNEQVHTLNLFNWLKEIQRFSVERAVICYSGVLTMAPARISETSRDCGS